MKILKRSTVALLLAAAAVPAWSGLSAQVQEQAEGANAIMVTGQMPGDLAKLPKGPVIQGVITARRGGQVQVTAPNGSNTAVLVATLAG